MRKTLNHLYFYIMPVFNVDGYHFSWTNVSHLPIQLKKLWKIVLKQEGCLVGCQPSTSRAMKDFHSLPQHSTNLLILFIYVCLLRKISCFKKDVSFQINYEKSLIQSSLFNFACEEMRPRETKREVCGRNWSMNLGLRCSSCPLLTPWTCSFLEEIPCPSCCDSFTEELLKCMGITS